MHQLFLQIYPQRPDVADKMRYDVHTRRHITTKLALAGRELVGQAGLFFQEGSRTVAGMGYHVHPKFQRKGVGTLLVQTALADAERHGIVEVVVRISQTNSGSLGLAKKLGFKEAEEADVHAPGMVVLKKELEGRTSHFVRSLSGALRRNRPLHQQGLLSAGCACYHPACWRAPHS